MLSKETYDKIIQYKPLLKHVVDGGGAPNLPLEYFNQVLSDNNIPQQDLYCEGCRRDLVKDIYGLIVTYEEANK